MQETLGIIRYQLNCSDIVVSRVFDILFIIVDENNVGWLNDNPVFLVSLAQLGCGGVKVFELGWRLWNATKVAPQSLL